MLHKNNKNEVKLPTFGYVGSGITAIVTMILLVMGPISAIAQTTNTGPIQNDGTTDVNSKDDVEAMIQAILLSVDQVDSLPEEKTLRFSEVGFVNPDGEQALLTVDCLPGETPDGEFVLGAPGVVKVLDFPAGINGENIALFVLLQNNGDETQAVAVGTFCEDGDTDGDGFADDDSQDVNRVIIRDGNTINNVIKNILKFNNVVNNNVTVINNQTGGNGTIVIPPVDNGTDTDGGNDTDTGGNDTDTTTPPVTNGTEVPTDETPDDTGGNVTSPLSQTLIDQEASTTPGATTSALTPEELQQGEEQPPTTDNTDTTGTTPPAAGSGEEEVANTDEETTTATPTPTETTTDTESEESTEEGSADSEDTTESESSTATTSPESGQSGEDEDFVDESRG